MKSTVNKQQDRDMVLSKLVPSHLETSHSGIGVKNPSFARTGATVFASADSGEKRSMAKTLHCCQLQNSIQKLFSMAANTSRNLAAPPVDPPANPGPKLDSTGCSWNQNWMSTHLPACVKNGGQSAKGVKETIYFFRPAPETTTPDSCVGATKAAECLSWSTCLHQPRQHWNQLHGQNTTLKSVANLNSEVAFNGSKHLQKPSRINRCQINNTRCLSWYNVSTGLAHVTVGGYG